MSQQCLVGPDPDHVRRSAGQEGAVGLDPDADETHPVEEDVEAVLAQLDRHQDVLEKVRPHRAERRGEGRAWRR